MIQDRLFLNDREVFLSDDTVIAVSYQINDIASLPTADDKGGNINDRQAIYTNTFKLPFNSVNHEIFEDAERISSGTKIPYRRISARLIKGGVTLVPYGYAVLERSTNFYFITVYSGNFNFFSLLGESKIADLDFSDLDHTWDEATIIANWAATSPTSNQGFVYALIDYGEITTTGVDYNIDRLLPSVFTKEILDRIFAKYGYNYSGSFKESEQFKRHIIPCVGDKLQHDAAWVTDKLFKAFIDTPEVFNLPKGGRRNDPAFQIMFPNDSTGGGFDNGDYWDEQNSIYMAPERIYQNLTAHLDFTVTNPAAGFMIRFEKVGLNNIDVTVAAGTASPIDISLGYGTWDDGQQLKVYIKSLSQDEDNQVTLSASSYIINTVSPSLQFLGIVQLGALLPDMTQKDFIRGIMQQFCLVPDTDHDSKTVILNFFDDIPANKPLAKDWTDKLHMDKNTWEINYRNPNYGQKNWLRYLDDSNIVDNIQQGVSVHFGDGFFEIDDENLPLEKEILTLPFAASLNKKINNWIVNITEIKRGAHNSFNETVKPRCCYLELLQVNPAIYINEVFSNAYLSGVDFDSVPYGRFKQTTCVVGATSLTPDDFRMGFDDSLIKDHYDGIKNVLNDFKSITALFKLNEIDISELNHFIPVFLKQESAYFYINNISNYKGEQLTKATLIKLGTGTDAVFVGEIPQCRDFACMIDSENFTELDMVAPSGNMIRVDWGDGSSSTQVSNGVMNSFPKTYVIAGHYLVRVCCVGITSLTISSNGILSLLNLPNTLETLDSDNNPYTTLDLSNCPALTAFNTSGGELTSLNLSNNPLVLTMAADNNKLTVTAVNTILIQLNAFGLLNGGIVLDNQTPVAPPSGLGAAAKAALIGKGWSVVTD